MNLKNTSLMNENPINIENDELNLNSQGVDNEILIIKLKQISATIALLENQYLKKS